MELFIDMVKDLGTDFKYKRKWLVRCNVCKIEYEAAATNAKTRGRTVCIKCAPTLVEQFNNYASTHPLYHTWQLLLRRVDNTTIKKQSNDEKYYNGIEVCEEWKDFNTFKTWMLDNGWKKGLSIDRENGTLGYYPDNCRVVTQSVQNSNKKVFSKSATGYSGITLSGRTATPYTVRVIYNSKTYIQKRVKTLKEAVELRNSVITNNNLPHPIQTYKELNE